ncbi:MAG: immunoglobulin-like domain-containing protein [Acutalibacteraceae bacterium]
MLESPKAVLTRWITMMLFILCLLFPAKSDALTLEITTENITSQTSVIEVKATNNTRREIWVSMDTSLILEMKVGDNWERVPMKPDDNEYSTEAWSVYYPGQSFNKSFCVSGCLVPVLLPGEYRLALSYEVFPNANSQEHTLQTAYVSFTVEQ